ncbi:putative molybdenum cofactor guanylyltransferase [Flavobacterium columnare]|uniref:Probable molybdenum cofactor guanylyltransferase n=2 Tax=Flavobacterium TaxID=237 RepID=A0ABW8PQU8_9FLAO|nr:MULTISPECIES: molybdenum cofactor guanylyltransferase [Flavobacterium]QYS88981.1 molybdenum cofactor guanylyltransferase [Flavobacterium davisii]SPE78079.1 putative molybdenum cofactor guanylyltransferase [Flavobacterium columnare]
MEIEGYILAGGKSSRMGTDKGLLLLNNIPFVTHIQNVLKTICKTIQIVTNNLEYKKTGYNIIKDIIIEKGPVGGIYTALSHSKTTYTLIVSVDSPLITEKLIKELIVNHISQNASVTIFGTEKIEIPLVGVYNTDLKFFFEEATIHNRLKLRELLKEIKTQKITISKEFESQLQNINTKEDYKTIINQFNKNAN